MHKIDGQVLRDLREERGYSLRECAEKLYISKSSIQRWETSVLPDDEKTLLQIAEIFDITVEDLYSLSTTKHKKEIRYKKRRMKVEQYVQAQYGLKWLLLCMFIPLTVLIIVRCI